MHSDSNHRGLQKYREARRKGKEKAILRNQIIANNPALANEPKKLEAIVDGALRARQATNIEVPKRGKQGGTRKVIVQVV